jgi:hydrogenase nickel incorporation protein HypA/HybF
MHELYIAQSILNSVQKSLPAEVMAEDVTQVRVECGQLDAVVPDSLVFLFDAIKAESHMPNAELLVEQIPVACLCKECSREFEMELPVFVCPNCQSGNVELLRGRGIRLTGITVNEPEDKDSGYTDHT